MLWAPYIIVMLMVCIRLHVSCFWGYGGIYKFYVQVLYTFVLTVSILVDLTPHYVYLCEYSSPIGV